MVFCVGFEFAGVPSGLLGESSFVVLWSWSDLLPEFASLEREVVCAVGWIDARGKGTEGLTGCSIGRWTAGWCVGECSLKVDK